MIKVKNSLTVPQSFHKSTLSTVKLTTEISGLLITLSIRWTDKVQAVRENCTQTATDSYNQAQSIKAGNNSDTKFMVSRDYNEFWGFSNNETNIYSKCKKKSYKWSDSSDTQKIYFLTLFLNTSVIQKIYKKRRQDKGSMLIAITQLRSQKHCETTKDLDSIKNRHDAQQHNFPLRSKLNKKSATSPLPVILVTITKQHFKNALIAVFTAKSKRIRKQR